MKSASFFLFCFSFILFFPLKAASEPVSLVIVGGGPAGLTAALYAARSGIDCILFEGDQPGGQLVYSSEVENYPGFFPSAAGIELVQLMRDQAKEAGAKLHSAWVKKMDLSSRPFLIHLSDGRIERAWALILASGAKPRQLGLPSEKKFWGKGVSSCAICDGPLYREKDVVVVGGGDAAFDEALLLSKIARKVTLIHRSQTLRASRYMQEQIKRCTNVELKLDQVVEEILGSEAEGVSGIQLRHNVSGTQSRISCQAVFIAIGQEPDSAWIPNDIKRDAYGYVALNPGSNETSVPGVFAAGDLCDPRYRQAITAAASGCKASLEARDYLNHTEQEQEK